MKLWIFSTIWRHVSKYWNQFASFGCKTTESGNRQAKHTEIKTKNLPSSTKKKGRLFKFNPKDFSDSFEPAPKSSPIKTKNIIKKKCKSFMKPVVGNGQYHMMRTKGGHHRYANYAH